MTMTVKQIKQLKDWLTNDLHKNRLKQQEDDECYINDTFTCNLLPTGVTRVATGKGYRMVSSPAEHIITSHPIVVRKQTSDADAPRAENVSKELNRWARVLLRQNPQPYKEFIKKLLGRGEAWLYVLPNDEFDKNDKLSLPFNLYVPDPLIVFMDTVAGDVNGVPRRFMFVYDRIASNVYNTYPGWKWTNRNGRDLKEKIPFMLYYDDEIRYADADGDPLYVDDKMNPINGDGIQENFYGVTAVHKYAGFGEASVDGDPASLCISRITRCRDKIDELTAIQSVLDHLIFKYAQPPMDYYFDPQAGGKKIDASEYSRETGAFNNIPVTGNIKDPLRKGVDMLPDQQLFQYAGMIESQIDEEDPLGNVGSVMGTSGRQQIDAYESGLRRFDSVVESAAEAFATAFGLAARMCDKRPSLYPKGLNKGDFNKNYDCTIELKADDPVEAQITKADGDRKYMSRIIDLKTNLTKYQNYTQEEAQEIINHMMVDDVTQNDPIVRRLIAINIAREMGMEKEYEMLESQFGEMEKELKRGGIGSQGGEPRVGNVKTQRGLSEPDVNMPKQAIRRSPVGV